MAARPAAVALCVSVVKLHTSPCMCEKNDFETRLRGQYHLVEHAALIRGEWCRVYISAHTLCKAHPETNQACVHACDSNACPSIPIEACGTMKASIRISAEAHPPCTLPVCSASRLRLRASVDAPPKDFSAIFSTPLQRKGAAVRQQCWPLATAHQPLSTTSQLVADAFKDVQHEQPPPTEARPTGYSVSSNAQPASIKVT
jgi:hypothetical protein